MTFKLIALCAHPTDPTSFLKYYNDVHIPLVRKIPGLGRLSVSEVAPSATGPSQYFLITEMAFPDKSSMESGMQSPEGEAVAADAKLFAEGLVTLLAANQIVGG